MGQDPDAWRASLDHDEGDDAQMHDFDEASGYGQARGGIADGKERGKLELSGDITGLLADLSGEQMLAANETENPVLIVAGAGSGKTRTLVGRLARLLLPPEYGGLGASPDSVMMVTFTNKAAREIQARIKPLTDALEEAGYTNGEKVWAGTFHSLSLRILRMESGRAGLGANFSIYDDADAEELLNDVVEQAGFASFDLDAFRANLELAKANVLTPAFLKVAGAEGELPPRLKALGEPEFVRIYSDYQAALAEHGAVDFSDLLNHVTQMMRTDKDVRMSWTSRFRHFMVDEVQDANRSQIMWLQHLSNSGQPFKPDDLDEVEQFMSRRLAKFPKPTVAFVGDDDQAIYGFRGSDTSVFRGIRNRFPGLVAMALSVSYRCQPNVLSISNSLVGFNTSRFRKTLRPGEDNPPAAPISFGRPETADDEAHVLARRIRANLGTGETENGEPSVNYAGHAVLLRTRSLAKRFAKALRAKNIPVEESSSSDMMKAAEVKDAMSFLSVLMNPDDEMHFRRIANKPARGLGLTSMSKAQRNARLNNNTLMQELRRVGNGQVEIPEGGEPYPKAFTRDVGQFMHSLAQMRRELGLSGIGASSAAQMTAADIGDHAETPAVLQNAGQAIEMVLHRTGYVDEIRKKVLLARGLADQAEEAPAAPSVFLSWLEKKGPGRKDDADDVQANEDIAKGRDERGHESVRRLANLASLIEKASAHGGLESFIQEIALDAEMEDKAGANAVKVLTIHAAKGLEFDHVHLPCWSEGVLPHNRALEEGVAAIEEERRLAYVALTRAKKSVSITAPRYLPPEAGLGRGQMRTSRFVDEITNAHRNLVNFASYRFSRGPQGAQRSNQQGGWKARPGNGDRREWIGRRDQATSVKPRADASKTDVEHPRPASGGGLLGNRDNTRGSEPDLF